MSSSASSVLPPGDLALDRELADIAASFQFLLDVTPCNLEDARAEFLGGDSAAPRFQYRPLEDDPKVVNRRLTDIDPEAIEDAAVSHLAQAKHRELSLQVEMLSARGTDAFRTLSIELYGAVSPSLLDHAHEILRMSALPAVADSWLDAGEFAQRAEEELDWYRSACPDLSVHVEVRSDCSAVMVSGGSLLIPESAMVASARVDPLLQHEIGTHIVTHVNGARQPLRLLAGLAGYEESQEGLGLLAEYIAGGLTPARLRQVASRVVAVDLMLKGAEFRFVHESLVTAGFSPIAAFSTSMRVFRSGGLTKDAIYLRGLSKLLAHVGAGRPIDAFVLGKMPLEELPLVEDLISRGALVEPLLMPRYLVWPESQARLGAIDSETTVFDLIREVG